MSAIPTALLTRRHRLPSGAAHRRRAARRRPTRSEALWCRPPAPWPPARSDADGSNVDPPAFQGRRAAPHPRQAARAAPLGRRGVRRSSSADRSPTFRPSLSPPISRQPQRRTAAQPGLRHPLDPVAGIGRVESDHGRNGGSSLRADGEVRPAILGPVLDGSDGNAAITDTDRRPLRRQHPLGPRRRPDAVHPVDLGDLGPRRQRRRHARSGEHLRLGARRRRLPVRIRRRPEHP